MELNHHTTVNERTHTRWCWGLWVFLWGSMWCPSVWAAGGCCGSHTLPSTQFPHLLPACNTQRNSIYLHIKSNTRCAYVISAFIPSVEAGIPSYFYLHNMEPSASSLHVDHGFQAKTVRSALKTHVDIILMDNMKIISILFIYYFIWNPSSTPLFRGQRCLQFYLVYQRISEKLCM